MWPLGLLLYPLWKRDILWYCDVPLVVRPSVTLGNDSFCSLGPHHMAGALYSDQCMCASVPNEVLLGVGGSTPFHIGIWNFPWGSSELSYTSSSHFIIVTPVVPELRALRFFTIGHMHVTVSWVFFYTISYRNLKLSMRFFWVKLHIDFACHRRDTYGSGVTCPWIFYFGTYASNSFPGFFLHHFI
jgi:hypothetical protein